MSGRSGYRKTGAKRPRRRVAYELSLTFTLPPALSAFVSHGQHANGVWVEGYGYVRVLGKDRPTIFRSAQEFLATVAKDHPPLCLSAVFCRRPLPSSANASSARPMAESYRISVASGHPVVTIARTKLDPSTFVR